MQQESPKNKLIPLEGVLEEQSKAKLILFDFALRPDGTAVVDLNTGSPFYFLPFACFAQ